MTRLSLVAVLAVVLAACSGSGADTTSTTQMSTTTTSSTTTQPPTTTSTSEPSTTTIEQTSTTTTTVPETTTTTVGDGDATTTTSGDDATTTTITTLAPPTSSSTTLAPGSLDPALEPWAGVFRQPAGYDGFLQLRADGVVRAGYDFAVMPFDGTWDYDGNTDSIVFIDFDIGDDCADAQGRYVRDTAPGGGMRLTLIEDECQGRVDYITQPDSVCRCFTWLPVSEPEPEEPEA